IQMGGRIYDPNLARFLQADPNIQAPTNLQNYNRYSYVLNNPLTYTDPSGYFFDKIFDFVKKYWKVIVAVVVVVVTYGAATSWVASWGTTGAFGSAATAATSATLTTAGAVATGAIAGAAGGFVGGALATGSLKGAFRGALTGAISGAAGGYANAGAVSGWGDAAKRIAVAAAGGCGAGKASGGSCSQGAKLAAVSQAITMGAGELYRKVSSQYNKTGEPHLLQEGISDVGKQARVIHEPHFWGQSDQAGLMKSIAKGPYMDAFAEFHDGLHEYLHDSLGSYAFLSDNSASLILTMPPSYVLTVAAAARPYSHLYSLDLMREGKR
ncbi:RHS repeat-associated core domain-containing protein, partial [Shewanella denitrificans]